MECYESSSECESENAEKISDVSSDEDTMPSYSDFDRDEFSINDLQIDIGKVDFEGAQENMLEIESQSHRLYEYDQELHMCENNEETSFPHLNACIAS